MLKSILILVVVLESMVCDSTLVMLYLAASCVFLVCRHVALDESLSIGFCNIECCSVPDGWAFSVLGILRGW